MIENAKPLTGWTEGFFKSYDGSELFCRIFEPPKIRHTLVILHGYGEHTGRYLKFSEKLKDSPVRLALFDCRGMGRSAPRSPDARSTDDYQKDIDFFIGHLRAKFGFNGKIILMGHSLGGLLAVEWGMAHPEAIKRLILSAPFLGLKGLPLLRALNAAVKFILPSHIYYNPVMPSGLSHDPAEVEKYQKDPLIKRNIPARLIGSIMDRLVCLQKKETVTMMFPVHVLTAGRDRIVDLKAARRFFDRLVAPLKEFTEFEGYYHEIFNETGQDRVFKVLKTILDECV